MTKILLVEDDPQIYKMYERLFKLEGYETELADNGQLGLDKLKTFKPDIILLDIMMPTMNGVEMMTHLKENPETKDIPIVVLTNVSDTNISHEVFSKGANLVIIKSEADPDEVIAWIKSVLTKASQPAPAPTAAPAAEPTTQAAPANDSSSDIPVAQAPSDDDTTEDQAL